MPGFAITAVRRVIASGILMATIGALTSAAPASAALSIGSPGGGFTIPAGSTATFSGIVFGACNSLSWGYQLDGGPNQVQATFPGGCGAASSPSVVIGPFASNTSLVVFMTDNHCSITYTSDGTPYDHVIVEGSNPYTLRFADAGAKCERQTATTNTFAGCNLCIDLAISDASIAAGGTSSTATEGHAVTAVIANLTDLDTNATASEYSASIDWGDGSTSIGTVAGSAGRFTVSGTHTYAEEGSEAVTVTIRDTDNSASTATARSTVTVGDAPLSASAACTAAALRSYAGRTATFADTASPSGTASDFTATINWGDGNSSAGTVSTTGVGAYAVDGTHTFPSTGQFTVTTTITDVGGSTASVSCSVVGFSFAPGGGSFVVSSQRAAMGSAVSFWGAQWAQQNPVSGGASSRSFKGFAESPAAPMCGARWTADPGSSTPPPAGPLPTYMGVIAADSTSKAGSVLSGDVVHVVVIKTDPGYAPNPGHAGTGTVVAIVC